MKNRGKKKRGVFIDPPLVLKCAQCAHKIDFYTSILPVEAICSYKCLDKRAVRLSLQGYEETPMNQTSVWKYKARYGCDEIILYTSPGNPNLFLALYASVT